MADTNVNYQCPACGGPLRYDGASSKLVCDYCGSAYAVGEIETQFSAKSESAAAAERQQEEKAAAEKKVAAQWDTESAGSDWGNDANGVKAYNCPSCGAELLCDATTAATSCPYCGNPTVVPAQFDGEKKPDLIIPFRLQKKDAIAALQKHYQGRPLLPKAFKKQNHIEEIKGVYVPFWLFDGSAYADVSFMQGVTHTQRTGNEEITRTDHFIAHRAGSVAFSGIPVDASSKAKDEYMDSVEPFNYEELKPFQMAYLPGFMADRYDQNADQCIDRANKRMEQTVVNVLRNTLPTGIVERQDIHQIALEKGSVKYALLPVWMLNTKWNGKDYMFAMNGQTGKMAGDLPADKSLLFKWAAGLFVGSFAVITALLALL